MATLNQVKYGCSALAGTNLAGNLKKDADGYYECIVGALNVYNSAGAFYDYNGARQLFESSSELIRRVKRGVLKGEYGHPKPEPNQKKEEFARRVMSIYETNICCHHAELTLDFDRVKDEMGRPVIAIISKVAPSGPMGSYLKTSLENKHENVCFSIRSFTDDQYLNGRLQKTLKKVVTFDFVLEPGISHAEKFKSPALEALNEETFSRGLLERAYSPAALHAGVANESIRLSAEELFASLGWTQVAAPSYLGW